LLRTQRDLPPVVVPLRTDKVLTKSVGFALPREQVSAAELGVRIENEMVGWDGIEPPTPGFSDLGLSSCKCA
jgi:hypothetical protein